MSRFGKLLACPWRAYTKHAAWALWQTRWCVVSKKRIVKIVHFSNNPDRRSPVAFTLIELL
jgi:hypothetical protein